MGKAWLEAQFLKPLQLRKMHCALIFLFQKITKVAWRTKALNALRFQKFFPLIAQFYALNLI